jgi:hypothetical protein
MQQAIEHRSGEDAVTSERGIPAAEGEIRSEDHRAVFVAAGDHLEPKQLLAGNPLYGFAGFLVADFRTRDFEQGRFDAWRTWSAIAHSNADPFVVPREGDTQYPPPIAPENPKDPAFLGSNQKAYDKGKAVFFKRVNLVAENIVTQGQSLGPIGNIAVQSLLNVITRKALT